MSAASALVLVGLALAAPIGARGEGPSEPSREARRGCSIEGHAALADVTARRALPGGRSELARVDAPPRDVRVSLRSAGIFTFETLDGEPRLTGWTSRPPPLSLAGDRSLPGVRVEAGAAVVRASPIEEALDVDLALDERITLRRVVVPCDELQLAAAGPGASVARPSGRDPLWAPRGRELSLRAEPTEGVSLTRIGALGPLLLEERERKEPFVRIHASLAHGEIDGWVRDSALAPPPP